MLFSYDTHKLFSVDHKVDTRVTTRYYIGYYVDVKTIIFINPEEHFSRVLECIKTDRYQGKETRFEARHE